MIYRKSSK